MNFMIGCNYWDSKSGTEMWVNWDEKTVDADLKALSEYGVEYLRVFPVWRDFQPLHSLRRYKGDFKEYRMHGKYLMKDEFGLCETCLNRFEKFTQIAKKYNMKLIVAIVTGWMSGLLFVPPAVEGKNHFTDPESLKLQIKYVRGFVRHFKDNPNIFAWELGNESNSMSKTDNPDEAYLWTATIRNAILSEDNSRMIWSGMHSLGVDNASVWKIQDQAELTDMMCPHPYPSPTVGGDKEPLNSLRTSLIPTFMVEYYSGVGRKPAIIEESGTFSLMTGNYEYSADFMRISLLSGWANGACGYLWWCGMEHKYLDFPPYSWGMIERELGLLYVDRSPKPVALEMKRLNESIKSMPFDELPDKDVDAACVLTYNSGIGNYMGEAAASYIMAKQAGFDMMITYCEQPLPDVSVYIVPCAEGWSCMDKQTYDALLKKAENGANVYFSVSDGCFADFEGRFGLRSFGMRNNSDVKEVDFGEYSFKIKHEKEYLLKSIGAEVLAEDKNGNIIFSRNKIGNGYFYFLNFPLERVVYNSENQLSDANKYPYYKIYEKVAENVLQKKLVRSLCPDIGVTQHKLNDNEYIIVALNYSDKKRESNFILRNGLNCDIEMIYGDYETISKCDMCVFKLKIN